MKTRLLITAILSLGINSFSYSQTTWAPVGAIWHYEYHGGWGEYISYVTIEATKDTVIQGIQCVKLEQRGPGSNPDPWTNEDYFTYESNDTVWFFDGDSFRMLYDFGADGGESWEAYGPSLWNMCEDSLTTVLVDSTGYQMINDISLRYLKASTPEISWGFNNCSEWDENHKIIQKIGSLEFLFPQQICGADMPTICYLRCYEDDEIGFYSTGIADSCTYEHGVGIDKIAFDSRVKLYPNPFKDYLIVELIDENSADNVGSIQIQDTYGNIALRIQLTQKITTIPVNDLRPGIYLTTIELDKSKSVRKLVKSL